MSNRQNQHERTSRTRLGEPLSPKREYQSLKTPKPLAWARSRAQTSKFSSWTRLGECLSPERETMSLKPLIGRLGENHESELYVELCKSRLGEMDPLERDLQGFASVHAPTSSKSYQNINQSLSTQRSGTSTSESCLIIEFSSHLTPSHYFPKRTTWNPKPTYTYVIYISELAQHQ